MVLPFNIAIERGDERVRSIVEHSFSILEDIGNVRIPRRYVGVGPWKSGDFGSIPWYVRAAYNPRRRQVNSSELWRLLEREPWQMDRHYELMILESDLYAPGTNFVFGETKPKILNTGIIIEDNFYKSSRPLIRGTILSLNRIRRWYGKDWEIVLLGMLLHEEGHFYGLPSASNPNFIRERDIRMRSRLDYGHCNDRRCIMEQVNTPGRMNLRDKVIFVARENPQWYCRYDWNALERNLNRLY